MRIELSNDPADFAARDWTHLVEADRAGTFFHTPAYLKVWWEEFGTGSPLLAFADEGGRPAGACAFEVVGEDLRFLGGFDVTDYMGPVAHSGREEEVAKELLGRLVGEGSWRVADLRGLAADSPWLSAMEAAAAAHGLRATRGHDGVAPKVELPPEFEVYMASLPAKLRHEIGRKVRRLAAEPGSYRIRLATADTIAADMDHFVQLHRGSHGPKGAFMDAGMEIFFRRLGEAFLPSGTLRLAFLEVNDTGVAGAIGFTHGDTFSLYNSAFDRAFARLGPGSVLVAGLIERAIDSGMARFDMLKGDLDYKYRFGARARPVERIFVER